MRLLALDLGSKRIGVAVSDELGWTAQGLTVLERRGGGKDFAAIADLVRQHQATGVVVGLPINMDGSEGPAAAAARRFGEALAKHLALPVHLWDERLTSWEAEGILREAEVTPRKRRLLVDKLAATLILKSYLEAHTLRPSDSGAAEPDDHQKEGGPGGDV
jgi:putative holliday junction resolvase